MRPHASSRETITDGRSSALRIFPEVLISAIAEIVGCRAFERSYRVAAMQFEGIAGPAEGSHVQLADSSANSRIDGLVCKSNLTCVIGPKLVVVAETP